MARASSGSRSSIRSIEPLMSAKSAVTVLRSPSKFWGAGVPAIRTQGSSDFLTAVGGVPSPAPHSPQKFSAGSMAAPHRGHFAASLDPHWVQNFRPSRLSAPHFAQRMAVNKAPSLARRSRLSRYECLSQRLDLRTREQAV